MKKNRREINKKDKGAGIEVDEGKFGEIRGKKKRKPIKEKQKDVEEAGEGETRGNQERKECERMKENGWK